MASPAASFPYIPFEEYERIEKGLSEKLEYLRGTTYLMAGASPVHNLIMVRCSSLLERALPEDSCFVLSSDQHVVSPENQADFMPDVTVVCGSSLDQLAYRLPNPTMVVEVLSPSTRGHDLGNKLTEYQRIPSMRAILYIDSESITVRLWQRPENSTWTAEPAFFQDPEARVDLPIGVSFVVKDLYRGTGLL